MPSSVTGVQTCALRSEEHTSELQSHDNIVCRLLRGKGLRSNIAPGARRGGAILPNFSPRGQSIFSNVPRNGSQIFKSKCVFFQEAATAKQHKFYHTR